MAYPFYADYIPNGYKVPHPTQPGQYWRGVGHVDEAGSGPRNVFGTDFEALSKMV